MGQRTTTVIGGGVGLFCGFALAMLVGAGDRQSGDGRYQLHVWSTHPAYGAGGSIESQHGAYRIDTQSGEIYSINGYNGSTSKLDFK